MKTIINIYSFLAIFIHEISHIFFLFIFGKRINNIEIKFHKNLEPEITVDTNSYLNKFQTFVVAYAPIIFFLIIIGLAFVSTFFLYLAIYEITNLQINKTLPSRADFNTFKEYDKNYLITLGFTEI